MPRTQQQKNVRLPNHTKPIRYAITLKPDFERFTFAGEETIHITLARTQREITLHAAELDIESAEVIQNDKKIFALHINYDKKTETATFKFSKRLPKGNITLKLLFRGMLNDKMRGFYRSHFMIGEKKHFIATTQFEATDARRAFPCFD